MEREGTSRRIGKQENSKNKLGRRSTPKEGVGLKSKNRRVILWWFVGKFPIPTTGRTVPTEESELENLMKKKRRTVDQRKAEKDCRDDSYSEILYCTTTGYIKRTHSNFLALDKD